MQFQSFLTLALSLFSAGSALPSTPDGNRFVRRHHDAIEAAVRDMAAEHSANVLKYKRGSGPSPVTFTCRTLVLDDISKDLTNRQIAQLVNYTNEQVLNKLNPGMTMFDPELFYYGGLDNSFNSVVGRWRTNFDYWRSGYTPIDPDTNGGAGVGGGDAEWTWDDFMDIYVGKREVSSNSHLERRAGSDGTNTTWYFTPVTEQEVVENGLQQAQVCLNVNQAVLTTLEKGSCSFATFEAHGTINEGGEVQVSIQQATEVTTTVTTEQTASSGHSLGTETSIGFEAGVEGWGVVAKGSTSSTSSTEAHFDVSNTQGTETSTSSSLTNTVQITFQQSPNQTCYVQLTQENCNAKLRMITPIVLTGKLHLKSSPDCKYNLDADGNCKNDLIIDLQTAMAGFKTDAVIVQYIDASMTATGTYKQQCVNGTDTDSPFQSHNSTTNVTTADPASATLTVYGHTVTAYALTTTVAEQTKTVQVMTNTVTPTVTVFKKTKDVATATVYPKTQTVTANNAKHTTVTSTRRPLARTHTDYATLYKGVRTVTNVPTTTVTKRVSQTLKPTRCRRSMDDDEEADVFPRSEPTAATRMARRDDAASATATATATATVTYAATTTLSDATTTFTDPIHPTTVTASGSTTTVTEAVSGTKTMPAVTTTDTTNTQYRFVTATAVATKIVRRVTDTLTVRGPARTSTVIQTVTKAASTRTVQGSATVTVKQTRTVTVTPHCTSQS